MSPSRTFILRPVATVLFMAAILLAGFVGYLQLPISALPEVDYPTMQIVTFYPGASPEVMATSVTAPLERQFGQVPGLQQMTSTSSDGSSVITLQFNLSLNIDIAEQEVQQAINASGTYLPADLPNPPIYSKTNPADAPIMTLALTSKTMPLSQIEDLADTRLAQKISQVSGVGLVSINGGQKPAVRIQPTRPPSPPTASTWKTFAMPSPPPTSIRPREASTARRRLTRWAPTINCWTAPATPISSWPTPTARRCGSPMSPRSRMPRRTICRRPGKTPRRPSSSTCSATRREYDCRGRWHHQIAAQVAPVDSFLRGNHHLDRSHRHHPRFRGRREIRVDADDRAGRRRHFVFLRTLAATFIAGVAVPLSLVGTFSAMYLCGFSLDNLSMMALTISTGFVVDDAIVMIENIVRYIEKGEKPLDAALKGAGQIGFTIVALTISLIAVLIPLLFMSDIVGRLFREFAITLSFTILISAVVSLTLTPMLASRLIKSKEDAKPNRLFQFSEDIFNGIISF